jgi:hypothetical protein
MSITCKKSSVVTRKAFQFSHNDINAPQLKMNNLDDFSLEEDQQSLGSGFVIAPQSQSVSIITDEFEASVLSGSTQDTPLAQIIGRFNFFGKVRIDRAKLNT